GLSQFLENLGNDVLPSHSESEQLFAGRAPGVAGVDRLKQRHICEDKRSAKTRFIGGLGPTKRASAALNRNNKPFSVPRNGRRDWRQLPNAEFPLSEEQVSGPASSPAGLYYQPMPRQGQPTCGAPDSRLLGHAGSVPKARRGSKFKPAYACAMSSLCTI